MSSCVEVSLLSLSAADEPLRQHGRLHTDDVGVAQDVVAEVFEPHTLEPLAAKRLDARLNAVQIGEVTLGYLTYGTETRISLPPSGQWYHVNVTLAGSSRIVRTDGERGETEGMRGAAVLLPHRTQTIEWAHDAAQFGIKIPRTALETHLSDLTRTQVTGPVDFGLIIDLTSRAGRGLLRCLDFVRREWDEDGVLAQHGGTRRHVEAMIMTNLLMAASGPHQNLLRQEHTTSRPAALKRALDYIHEHAHELPTLTDLTAAAGVSARTLQLQFLRNLGCTPLQYLRDVRLRAARAELLHPRSADVTVTDVATSWGFYNLGRFSSLYRSVYGETPSETLRRAKGG